MNRKLTDPTSWGSQVRKTILFIGLMAIGIYGLITHQDVLGGATALLGVLQTVID